MDIKKLEDIRKLEIVLSYQDTDVGGVVYHGRYLDYAERARAKLIRSFFGKLKPSNEQSWVVKKIEVNYIKPAFIDDVITLKTSILELRAASIIFKHLFYVEEKEIVNINAQIVNLDSALKPCKLEKDILDKMSLLLNTEKNNG